METFSGACIPHGVLNYPGFQRRLDECWCTSFAGCVTETCRPVVNKHQSPRRASGRDDCPNRKAETADGVMSAGPGADSRRIVIYIASGISGRPTEGSITQIYLTFRSCPSSSSEAFSPSSLTGPQVVPACVHM